MNFRKLDLKKPLMRKNNDRPTHAYLVNSYAKEFYFDYLFKYFMFFDCHLVQ